MYEGFLSELQSFTNYTHTARLPMGDVWKSVFRVKHKIVNSGTVETPKKKRVYSEGVREVREQCVEKTRKNT